MKRAKAEEAGQEEGHRGGTGHEGKTVSLGRLPHDLAIAVLMRLPLRSLVQMRVLSTSLNSFLRSPPFPQPPLLISDPGLSLGLDELIAYCPHLKTWFPLPMIQGYSSPGQDPSAPRLVLASSASGGLICAVVTALAPCSEVESQQASPPPQRDGNIDGYVFHYHVLVFNCFTGASKRLPLPLADCSLSNDLSVHMFVDASAPGAYYVVLVHGRALPSLTDLSVYSSRTGCWMEGHATSAEPYPATLGDIQKSDLFSYCYDYGTLFAYAIHSDSWISIPIIPKEKACPWHCVFKWQGRVFLASTLMGNTFSFKVCVLTPSSRGCNSAIWVEVATTPARLVRPFPLGSQAHFFNFLPCGNLVCMTGYYYIKDNGDLHYPQPLVYDLTEAIWYNLPRPCIKGTNTDFGIALLALQPHLQALP